MRYILPVELTGSVPMLSRPELASRGAMEPTSLGLSIGIAIGNEAVFVRKLDVIELLDVWLPLSLPSEKSSNLRVETT